MWCCPDVVRWFPVHTQALSPSGGHSSDMNIEQMNRDIHRAKQIEAGLLAQEILDGAQETISASEQELTALVDQGRQAKEDLILAHLGLVAVIARQAARLRRVPFSDLFQEGCVALHHAVLRYDWRKGPFGPYAGMWIRSAVRKNNHHVWVPIEQIEVEDVASSSTYDKVDTRHGLTRALEQIPPGQSQILRMRAGWDGHPRTRKDIAEELGLTVAKVRHLERVGLESVRQHWELAEAA